MLETPARMTRQNASRMRGEQNSLTLGRHGPDYTQSTLRNRLKACFKLADELTEAAECKTNMQNFRDKSSLNSYPWREEPGLPLCTVDCTLKL